MASPSKRIVDRTWKISQNIVFDTADQQSTEREDTQKIEEVSRARDKNPWREPKVHQNDYLANAPVRPAAYASPRRTNGNRATRSPFSISSRAGLMGLAHHPESSNEQSHSVYHGIKSQTYTGSPSLTDGYILGKRINDEHSGAEQDYGTIGINDKELDVVTRNEESLDTASKDAYSSLETLAKALTINDQEDVDVPATDEPSHEPLVYHIPEEIMQKAAESANQSRPMFWSYALYRGPDDKPPTRHYCKTLEQSERVAQMFLDKTVVGFDIEWVPNYYGTSIKQNVSLMQIASEDRIALFHISLHKGGTSDELIAPSLRRILESSAIRKAGVAISADMTRIGKHLGIKAKGIFELSHLHKLVNYVQVDTGLIDRRLVNLAALVEEHLHFPLDKDENVRGSTWSEPLGLQQIEYAASDAYAGIVLFRVLDSKRRALIPVPPLPYHAELKLPIRCSYDQDFTIAAKSRVKKAQAPALQKQGDAEIYQEPSLLENAVEPYNDDEDAVDWVEAVPDIETERLVRSWQPQDPAAATQLLLSDTWVNDFRESVKNRAGRKAGPAQLKTYALWHQHALSVQTIAALRSPPLKDTTAANYVLESIMIEKLPFDNDRIDEVLGIVGEDVVRYRFPGVYRMRQRNND